MELLTQEEVVEVLMLLQVLLLEDLEVQVS
jgi:hypothetical protein